jgi:phosphoheptose isomerase
MAPASINAIHEYLVRSRDTIQAALDDPSFAIAVTDIVEAIADALGHGRKLLPAGNGGSTADAQHLAGKSYRE